MEKICQEGTKEQKIENRENIRYIRDKNQDGQYPTKRRTRKIRENVKEKNIKLKYKFLDPGSMISHIEGLLHTTK